MFKISSSNVYWLILSHLFLSFSVIEKFWILQMAIRFSIICFRNFRFSSSSKEIELLLTLLFYFCFGGLMLSVLFYLCLSKLPFAKTQISLKRNFLYCNRLWIQVGIRLIYNDLNMIGVCCGLTVSESGEGMSWIMLLLLLYAEMSTIGTGGLFWILLSMLLHKGVPTIGTGGDRREEYCIKLTT